MNIHSLARTTPRSRALIVHRVQREGRSVAQTAQAFGVSPRTVSKWLARHRTRGVAGLRDRSSRPRRSPEPRHPRSGGDARQRPGVAVAALPAGLSSPGLPPPAHPSVSTAHQRQGRALHPDAAAGMGLRSALHALLEAHAGAADLAALLQSSPATWESRWTAALQPTPRTL